MTVVWITFCIAGWERVECEVPARAISEKSGYFAVEGGMGDVDETPSQPARRASNVRTSGLLFLRLAT